jgi:hypothetical protein
MNDSDLDDFEYQCLNSDDLMDIYQKLDIEYILMKISLKKRLKK